MATYAYQVEYVENQAAEPLPEYFEPAMARHRSLRKSAVSLPTAAKEEFSRRLTQGVAKGFWSIEEVADVRKLKDVHFLPAGFVCKDPAGSSTTKVRLVLDPSQAYNGRLLAPYNAESTLASVLRKLQAIPVIAVQDIETAFWRLRLDQKKRLCFLMDYDEKGGADQTGVLTAQVTPTSRLVAVMVLCVVMGVSQSGLYLALARGDVDIEDKVLLRLLKELVYVDDLHHGVLPGEVQAIQNRTFPSLPLADMERECEDTLCCPGPVSYTHLTLPTIYSV